VSSVFWNGAHDVMQVASGSGEEILIPVVHRYILSVDQRLKRVVVVLDD
jgi:ribosomal 30S subunit maturation factor RimM